MSQLAYSSVPAWARTTVTPDVDGPDWSGRSYILVGVGPAANNVLRRWMDQLPHGKHCHALCCGRAAEACDALRAALADARVGVRVLVAAPVGEALALRATATTAGLADDEIHVETTGSGVVEVFCAHCRRVTSTSGTVDDVVDCVGCGRNLLVYHHVSRRSGRYLGFMVDAEAPTGRAEVSS
ncbi:dimethylamine monooxygenase subunit DmmA family protein [Gordonia sp. CPCC 206044]|uniref:dimethylamine monooxygenase subunit DmmA family protein n=1 Tax=Gordonia sp. CPCC 206044 TaxID=3140793 RepID=UPI003AF39ABB